MRTIVLFVSFEADRFSSAEPFVGASAPLQILALATSRLDDLVRRIISPSPPSLGLLSAPSKLLAQYCQTPLHAQTTIDSGFATAGIVALSQIAFLLGDCRLEGEESVEFAEAQNSALEAWNALVAVSGEALRSSAMARFSEQLLDSSIHASYVALRFPRSSLTYFVAGPSKSYEQRRFLSHRRPSSSRSPTSFPPRPHLINSRNPSLLLSLLRHSPFSTHSFRLRPSPTPLPTRRRPMSLVLRRTFEESSRFLKWPPEITPGLARVSGSSPISSSLPMPPATSSLSLFRRQDYSTKRSGQTLWIVSSPPAMDWSRTSSRPSPTTSPPTGIPRPSRSYDRRSRCRRAKLSWAYWMDWVAWVESRRVCTQGEHSARLCTPRCGTPREVWSTRSDGSRSLKISEKVRFFFCVDAAWSDR